MTVGPTLDFSALPLNFGLILGPSGPLDLSTEERAAKKSRQAPETAVAGFPEASLTYSTTAYIHLLVHLVVHPFVWILNQLSLFRPSVSYVDLVFPVLT